jgi:signal transduction histidine kinase
MLIAALGVLGLGLVAATFFQVRFGLKPLRAMRQNLARIRSGEAERLEGEQPEEIRPLQQELNALIQSNREIVERARTHVGNLAHALKTPLSVIANEARTHEGPLAAKVIEQAAIMRTQITHHLDRARVAARSSVIGDVTEVEPVLQALKRTLDRIYEERGLDLEIAATPGLKFQGEKQDFEEMVGNLLDNACKWARSRVTARAAANGAARFTVTIDDDGPGLTEAERARAVKRGQRLDETKPGSGLGLSIVADLAHLYKGEFALEPSPEGGLRARLDLPAA